MNLGVCIYFKILLRKQTAEGYSYTCQTFVESWKFDKFLVYNMVSATKFHIVMKRREIGDGGRCCLWERHDIKNKMQVGLCILPSYYDIISSYNSNKFHIIDHSVNTVKTPLNFISLATCESYNMHEKHENTVESTIRGNFGELASQAL